jgi:hypothetical protein
MATMVDKNAATKRLGFAWLFALMTLVLFGALVYLMLREMPAGKLVPWIIGAAVCALTSVALSFSAMLSRAGASGSHALFDTWFPLFMGAVPVAGPFIALLSVRKLLFLDRLNAATITTTSGSSRSRAHYDRTKLHGSGRPAGLVLLILALVQPLIALTQLVDLRAKLGLEPITLSWDGSPLRCAGSQRYVAKGLALEPLQGARDLVQLGGSCQLRLSACTLADGDQPLRIRITKRASLVLDGCTLKGQVTIWPTDDGRVDLRRVTIVNTKSTPVRAFKRARVTLTDSELARPKGHALRADGSSSVRLERTTLRGGVYISSRAKVSMHKGQLDAGSRQAVYIYGDAVSLELDGVTVRGGDGISVGRNATVTIKGGVVQASRTALRVSGRESKLVVEGAAIGAPTAASASSGGLVSFSSARIVGDLRASSKGKIVLVKSPVKGRLRQYGSGVISQLSAGSAKSAAADVATLQRRRVDLVARYKKFACAGLMGCWDGYEGVIKGYVTMRIGVDGTVQSVQAQLRRAPATVATCMRAAAAKKALRPFYGPVGTLRCSFSGSAVGGSKMISTKTAYHPDRGAKIFSEAAK